MSLGKWLRIFRAVRGLTIRRAAALIGITAATLSELERDLRKPHDLTLAKIAKAYGIPVEELIERCKV